METPLVRLYYSPLKWIGFGAIHPHLITHDKTGWNRWEIWDIDPKTGSYLRKNGVGLNHHMGRGDQWVAAEWHGNDAQLILDILKEGSYPYKYNYWFWPGPNSNTFIGWVLRRAQIKFDFPFRAWGSSYR
jgi:hypothetical protein